MSQKIGPCLIASVLLAACNCSEPSGGDGGGSDAGIDQPDTGPNGDDAGSEVDGGGSDVDGGGGCVPSSAGDVCPGSCGFVSDGCSNVIDCSSAENVALGGVACEAGFTCTGEDNTCVPASALDAGACTPRTCAELGHTCGAAPDGCGGRIDCWPAGTSSCPSTSQACIPSSPGGPQTCVMGTVSCSGSLCDDLPTCAASSPTTLSGVVVTPGIDPEGDGTFVNRVPVPNAIVYIPADPGTPLPAIYQGVDGTNPLSCGRCEDEQFVATGQSVLASAITDYRGEFTLEGRIPHGVPFNLVIKAGKWRRVIEIPARASATDCMPSTLTTDQTRLNTSMSDGLPGTHFPRIAIATGEVDEMECVLRNIGVAESEFTVPSGSGRIHMYRMDGAHMGTCTGSTTWGGGAHACSDSRTRQINGLNVVVPNFGCWNDGGTPRTGCSWNDQSVNANTLYTSDTTLYSYDMVIWDCEGDEVQHNADEPRIEAYVNEGGRMFASHFAYTWIEGNGTLDDSADWYTTGTATSGTGFVSLPTGPTMRAGANAIKSLLFRDWLDWQGALTGTIAGAPLESPGTPQFPITDPRDRAGANVGPSTDEWVYRNNSGARVQQLSFNTPYGATEETACGRVAYSGFHVADTDNNDAADYFPTVCTDDGDEVLTPQERVLVFMLFDLNACVSAGDPATPPSCTPATAAMLCPGVDDACGFLSDGCGGLVDCGGCSSGRYCVINECMTPSSCTPATCAGLGYACGQFPDGCGGIADGASADTCGSCPPGQTCGPNGTCSSSGCTPNPNACGSVVCGNASNGCGAVVSCGVCGAGEYCFEGGCFPFG